MKIAFFTERKVLNFFSLKTALPCIFVCYFLLYCLTKNDGKNLKSYFHQRTLKVNANFSLRDFFFIKKQQKADLKLKLRTYEVRTVQ
jgi:hypothetical protein